MRQRTRPACRVARGLTILIAAIASIVGPAASKPLDPPNAADHYNRAFERMNRFDDDRFERLMEYLIGPPGVAPSPEIRAMLHEAQPIITDLRRATRTGHIDWGINLQQDGPNTLLPHLSPMRRGMYFLALDARMRMHDGDARGATESLSAAMRMSQHVTADSPVLITTLVGVSMFSHTAARIEEFIGQGAIPQDEARALLGEVGNLLHDDPFHLAASIEGERQGFAKWIINNYSEEGGAQRFTNEWGKGLYGLPEDQTQFEAAMHGYNLVLSDIQQAVGNTDDLGHAKRELERLNALVEQGFYGPLAQQMLPAYERAIDTMIRTYDRMATLIDQLHTIASDPDGADSLRNAALWYLRAIAMHDLLDDDEWSLVDSARVDGPDRLSSESKSRLGAMTERAVPIVEILLEASRIERCNFDLHGNWRHRPMHCDLRHLGGMERNAHLLRAAAIMALEDSGGNDRDDVAMDEPLSASVALAAALLHMGAHVAADERTVSLRQACDIIQMGIDLHKQLEREEDAAIDGDRQVIVRALQSAVDRLKRHHGATVTNYRKNTSGYLLETYVEPKREPDGLSRIIAQEAAGSHESRTIDPDDLNDAFLHDDLIELDRLVKRALGGTDQIETLIEEYGERHPADLARWLLEPLIETTRRVESLVRAAGE